MYKKLCKVFEQKLKESKEKEWMAWCKIISHRYMVIKYEKEGMLEARKTIQKLYQKKIKK